MIAQGAITVQRASSKPFAQNTREWPYAQTQFALNDDSNNDTVLEAFEAEVKIFRRASHHHVMELIAAYRLEEVE